MKRFIGLALVLFVPAVAQAADIENVTAYFASLPGAASTAKSAFLPNLARTGVTFPENYKATFGKYYTLNFPATKQVRHFYANKAREAGWGKDIPEMLRNED